MHIITLLILGVLLMLIGTLGSQDSAEEGERGAEETLAQMCSSIDGVGECRVMISYDGDAVYAVAVACEGGDRVDVKNSISELVSSLYGIGYNRISVLKISGQ